MAWGFLFLAGLFEIGWAVGLKYTMGFTRVGPSVATLIAMVASLALLSIAVRTLPLGTAYAIWTGIGTVGAAILGIVLFREPATPIRLICILLIVIGLVGLKFGGAPTRPDRVSENRPETIPGPTSVPRVNRLAVNGSGW